MEPVRVRRSPGTDRVEHRHIRQSHCKRYNPGISLYADCLVCRVAAARSRDATAPRGRSEVAGDLIPVPRQQRPKQLAVDRLAEEPRVPVREREVAAAVVSAGKLELPLPPQWLRCFAPGWRREMPGGLRERSSPFGRPSVGQGGMVRRPCHNRGLHGLLRCSRLSPPAVAEQSQCADAQESEAGRFRDDRGLLADELVVDNPRLFRIDVDAVRDDERRPVGDEAERGRVVRTADRSILGAAACLSREVGAHVHPGRGGPAAIS